MRIILADHHVQALWALKMMLGEDPEFELMGEAANSESLLMLAEEQTVDLILVDRELPGVYIEDLITSLHTLEPRPLVIAMSTDSEHGRMLLRAGADAFVSKGDQPEWLLHTLHRYAARIESRGRSE